MTDESLNPICELAFFDADTGTRLIARLWAPILEQGTKLYYCDTEILGLIEGKRQRLYSDGQFEALTLALTRFRVVFARQTGNLRSYDGSAPHMIFPKEVPWIYGSDVYQKICNLVDNEVQVIEDERTRRREGRDKTTD